MVQLVQLELDEVRARSFAGEVPLHTLEIGDRFACLYQAPPEWNLPDKSVSGTVLWIGQGSVEVIVDGEKDTTRWATDTTIIKIGKGEQAMATAKQVTPAQKPTIAAPKDGAAVANQNTVKAYQARYALVNKKFNEALASEDSDAIEQAQGRLEALTNEAATKGVTQEQLEGSGGLVAAPSVNAGGPPKLATKAQQDEAKMNKRNEALKEAKASTAKVRVKKEKVLRPCLVGCGAQVPGNFAMGHDAKLKSLIYKIERGEESFENVPDVVQDLLKFKKGELVTEKDDKGKVTSKTQLWECIAAPVKFPGRDESTGFKVTTRED